MKIDDLAYELYINDMILKIGDMPKHYYSETFFFRYKKFNEKYYNKANSIIRKQKLQKLNEI